jgi:hypothetical protein
MSAVVLIAIGKFRLRSNTQVAGEFRVTDARNSRRTLTEAGILVLPAEVAAFLVYSFA